MAEDLVGDEGQVLHRTGPLSCDARAAAMLPALAGLPEDALVVACFEAPPELIAASRAILAAGYDVEPWQIRPEGSNWRDMVRRVRRLIPFRRPVVLAVSATTQALFGADERSAFESVLCLEADAPSADDLPTIDPARLVYIETAGTTRPPRPVAISFGALAYRAAIMPKVSGTLLRTAPLDSVAGCQAIAVPEAATLWLDPDRVASSPGLLLEALSTEPVDTLQISPGLIARLLPDLDATEQRPETAPSVIEITADPVHLSEAQRFQDALTPLGATPPALRLMYQTVEVGPVLTASGDPVPQDGRHPVYEMPVGQAEVRVVDPEFRLLGPGLVGEVQVRHAPALAAGYRNPRGKLTPIVDGSGWVKTGDRGVATEKGLILTSADGAKVVMPRREVTLSDLEARLRTIPGVRPETVAVTLPASERHGTPLPGVEVFFDTPHKALMQIDAVAASLFSVVVAETGVQPRVYRVRPDQLALNPALAPRRAYLQRLVRNGYAQPLAAPSATGSGTPFGWALHERIERIGEIWQEVLETADPPGPEADFFALGADSLSLTSMLDQVEAQFGCSVDPEMFFERPTVAALAGLVRVSDQQPALQQVDTPAPQVDLSPESDDVVSRLTSFTDVWRGERAFEGSLMRSANTGGSNPPLFWILQSESSFLALAEALGPEQPFHAFRSAVGVIDHYTEPALEAIGDRYLWELLAKARGRPFYLGGNCQGAIIALLLARRLRAAGAAPKRLIMMEWFFDFGGYDGPTSFLTGADSFVAELQLTAPSLSRLAELFPGSTAHQIPGAHGAFFRSQIVDGVAGGIRAAMADR